MLLNKNTMLTNNHATTFSSRSPNYLTRGVWRLTHLLILIALIIATTAQAKSVTESPTIFNKQPVGHFTVSKTAGYQHYLSSLNYLIWMSKQKDHINRFCLMGYQWPDNNNEAIVIWQNMQLLYRWQPQEIAADTDSQLDALIFAPVYFLTATSDSTSVSSELTLGTTPLSTDEVNRIQQDCQRYGEQVELQPITISDACQKNAICPDPFEARVAACDFCY